MYWYEIHEYCITMSLVINSQNAELMASVNSFKALHPHEMFVYVYNLHT
jgi:hypothetical protein